MSRAADTDTLTPPPPLTIPTGPVLAGIERDHDGTPTPVRKERKIRAMSALSSASDDMEYPAELFKQLREIRDGAMEETEDALFINSFLDLASAKRNKEAALIVSKLNTASLSQNQQAEFLNFVSNGRNHELLSHLVTSLGFDPNSVASNNKDCFTTMAEQSVYRATRPVSRSYISDPLHVAEMNMARTLLLESKIPLSGFENKQLAEFAFWALSTPDPAKEHDTPYICLDEMSSTYHGLAGKRNAERVPISFINLFQDSERMNRIIENYSAANSISPEIIKTALTARYSTRFNDVSLGAGAAAGTGIAGLGIGPRGGTVGTGIGAGHAPSFAQSSRPAEHETAFLASPAHHTDTADTHPTSPVSQPASFRAIEPVRRSSALDSMPSTSPAAPHPATALRGGNCGKCAIL